MSLKIFSGKKKIFIIITILFFSILIISPVLAAPGDYVPLVKIPGVDANAGLFSYLSGIYSFLISIVGILAMAVLVYGGMRYITSAGNTASVEEAKESINAALTGLILALVSWLIFATINKDILVLKNPGVSLPGGSYDYNATKGCTIAPGSGTQGSPCKCLDFNAQQNAPLVYGSGGDCNNICANVNNSSSNGLFHCIKAGVRVGWVGGNPSGYNDNQLRALATNIGTDANPFPANNGAHYIFEVEKYSTSFYPIEAYFKDGGYDGNCDDPLTNVGYNKSTAVYGIAPAGSTCTNSVTPLAITCSQLFCIRDTQGHTASTLIYYAIRAAQN